MAIIASDNFDTLTFKIQADLLQIFSHIVDNCSENSIGELARMLALIWKCKLPTIRPISAPRDLYIELKKEPSFFKAQLPSNFSGNNIDLCLPAYTDEDGTMYENPLHDDLQFHEMVDLVNERIDKGRGQHVIVLAGVSGGGKTSAMFAVATKRWAVYLDCSHRISFCGNLIYTELNIIRKHPPTLKDFNRQGEVLNTLDLALLSRGLLLIMMLIQKKVSSPKEWLFTQLQAPNNGFAETINEIMSILLKQNLNDFTIKLLCQAVNACLDINDLLLIYDEAQLLCSYEYGEYNGSRTQDCPWNLLQAYTHYVLGSFPITLLLAGTSIHIAGGLSLVTSVGKDNGIHEVQVVLKLPFLMPDDVLRSLNAAIDLQGVADSTCKYLGTMLSGRPRGCAYFITLLVKNRSTGVSKDEEIWSLIKIWHDTMCKDMAYYLRKTCESLGDRVNIYQAISDVVSLRVSSNSTFVHAIALLQHSILPSKKPPYITLAYKSRQSQDFEIYTILESFLIPSIELFLKQRGVTFIDILVNSMTSLQHIKSISNQLYMVFATAMIQRYKYNVRRELAQWTDDKNFVFPNWITPNLMFVTTSNLATAVSLVDYIEDVLGETPHYLHNAIQPEETAGSDLVLCLVDNVIQHIVLMTVSCTISSKNILKGKIMEQALKANLQYQYMIVNKQAKETKETKETTEIMKTETKNVNVISNYCKKRRLVVPIDISANNNDNDDSDSDIDNLVVVDDNSLTIDENFDLDYINTAKLFKVSKDKKILHDQLVSQISKNYIHVLVELPHRVKPYGTITRPKTFRLNVNGDLIIIVDDRNVAKVLGKSVQNLVEDIQERRKRRQVNKDEFSEV